MKDKFNYTARETIHYICPCCAAEWQTNKLEYCPNCEVKMLYSAGEGYHDVEEFYKEDDSAGEEVWNKEAIELVRRHIPNNALAKDYILELLTRQPVSEGEITARELNSPSILAERAGKFAIWLDENRWFNYKNGKWHYTFEHGTAISMESYEKNYTKTHTELYKLFLKELLNR